MATLEKLVVRLEADNAKLVKALKDSSKVTAKSSKQMEKSIGDFSKDAQKSTKKLSDTMSVFAGVVMAQVVTKAIGAVSRAFSQLTGLFTTGIKDAAGLEQSLIRLANSLVISGKFTKEAQTDLESWIATAEEMTGIDDELIAGNLALLSSMTKLDAEGLKKGQQAALDMAAALGIDLKTATNLVGKAVVGEVSSLKRYGIEIEEGATKADTLSNVLNGLTTQFGGAAAGAMKSYTGAMVGMNNATGNFFQAIGQVVVENPAVIAAISAITKNIGGMTKDVEANADAWRIKFAGALGEAIITVAKVISPFELFFSILKKGFTTLIGFIASSIISFTALKNVMSGQFKAAAKNMRELKEVNAKMTEDLLANSLAISQAVAKVGLVVLDTSRAMAKGGEKDRNTLGQTKDKVEELRDIEIARMMAINEFAKAQFTASVAIIDNYALQTSEAQMALDSQEISQDEFFARRTSALQLQQDTEIAMIEQALNNEEIKKDQAASAITAIEARADKERTKNRRNQEKIREGNFKSTMGTIATLASSGNRELAAIGKAAAVYQATIDGYAAVQKALSAAPPPFNFALAAVVGAATAVNIAKIAGTNLRHGIDSVPGVGSKDNFPAVLAPGERVVPSETNKDLTAFLEKTQENQTQPVFNLNFHGPVWSDKASAGAEIVEAINEAVARGMSLRLLNT